MAPAVEVSLRTQVRYRFATMVSPVWLIGNVLLLLVIYGVVRIAVRHELERSEQKRATTVERRDRP